MILSLLKLTDANILELWSSVIWNGRLISIVYSKLLKFTGTFYQLRCYLSGNILRLLYFAFVHSQVLFGIEVYANTSRAQLNKLCVLNIKILRIIQNKPLRTPVVNLYKSYNTLPIPKLHHFQLLCLVFKYLNCSEKLPTIFANFFTYNSEIHAHNTRSTNDLHYPVSILCVESDALNLKQAYCGTVYWQNWRWSRILVYSKDKWLISFYLKTHLTKHISSCVIIYSVLLSLRPINVVSRCGLFISLYCMTDISSHN